MGGCRGCCSCIGVSPMDENSPLSPKANAFSIASLISVAAAAEQAGKGALEERRGGRSAPARPGCRPQKMHFSTVTRDMEGERRARPLRAAGTGPPRATASRRVFTRPGPAAGPEGAHGARPGRGAGRRGLCRAPPRQARAPAVLPGRIRLCPCPGGGFRRLRRLDPRLLGGAGASSDSAGRAQGSGGPGLGSRWLCSPCPARGPRRK